MRSVTAPLSPQAARRRCRDFGMRSWTFSSSGPVSPVQDAHWMR